MSVSDVMKEYRNLLKWTVALCLMFQWVHIRAQKDFQLEIKTNVEPLKTEVNMLTKEQTDWLDRSVDGSWTIRDGVINVYGSVVVDGYQQEKIPVQFGIIDGDDEAQVAAFAD